MLFTSNKTSKVIQQIPRESPLFQNKFSIAVATVFLSMSQYTSDSNPTIIDGEYILNSDCICKRGSYTCIQFGNFELQFEEP